MIIDLNILEHGPRNFDFTFEPGWWQADGENDQILGLHGPLECKINIAKAGSNYILEGSLLASVRVSCDRCLEICRRELDSQFNLLLTAHSSADTDESEIELSENDMSVHFVKSKKVDLSDIVREQIYLSVPMKSLCCEDCSGLCHICGTNLNKKNCGCQRGEGHPGFSKLKTLKFKR